MDAFVCSNYIIKQSRVPLISARHESTSHRLNDKRLVNTRKTSSTRNHSHQKLVTMINNNNNNNTPSVSTLLILILAIVLLSNNSINLVASQAQQQQQQQHQQQIQQPQPQQQPQSSPASASASVNQILFKYNEQEKSTDYWLRAGRRALDTALKNAPNVQRAKSSVLFIGDGMSLPTITAARILSGQLSNRSGEEEQLAFDRLQNVALIKTYNIDQQVPDSAATATAILCGVKANFYTLGVNANVRLNDTNCQKIQQNQVNSILKQAQEAGKSTGIVTNTRITHATPAAAYAHVANRRWECDTFAPKNINNNNNDPNSSNNNNNNNCKDIARQLIEDEPGSKLNVIMGGGRRCFFGVDFLDPGTSGHPGMRQDGRNLIEHWLDQRRANNATNFAFVNSTKDLKLVDADTTDYLLGLFSYSHMNYEELRDTGPHGEPSLAEMVHMAIRVLSKNPLGYVLLVEGGRIDHAHHENVAGVALRETIALSWAVQLARGMIDQRDTLLAVTSDHAHALTINGLAPRGNPILGVSRFKENATQVPYTTLLYGTGPGNHRPRLDPTVGPNSSESFYYVQHAAIHQEEAFHDGSDVAIFASGPFAHLFQGVQEQSYIAHVFAYSMCIGDYTNEAHCQPMGGANMDSLGDNSLGAGRPGTGDQIAAASAPRSTLINDNNNYWSSRANNNINNNNNNNNPSLGRPGDGIMMRQPSDWSSSSSSSGRPLNRSSWWPMAPLMVALPMLSSAAALAMAFISRPSYRHETR